MSDAGESSDIKEIFEEDETKVNIETTSINLDCVKNAPNEEALDFKEGIHTTRYRITLECKNMFGESSKRRKIEEDSDNLIGFLENDVIMENSMIKLEAIKEEDDRSFDNFYCSKCKSIYKGYCLKCSTLLQILNNNSAFVISESESNSVPTDILEIRETFRGKGVYLLRTLPINIIFGPFEGILGIETIVGHSWKIIANRITSIKSGNWMKNVVCATSPSMKNLDIFQIDDNLYFKTNREITEGEELLIYYNYEELQQLDNTEECLYTPQKHQKLPKIFACTVCCLGFGSNKCLIEHKRKCPMEHSRSMKGLEFKRFSIERHLDKNIFFCLFHKDFVLIECHYCKMWMEKWEHEEYHVAYCMEKHQRICNDYSEAVDRSEEVAKEMKNECGMEDNKETYQRDNICSRLYNRKDNLQFDTKDYQCFSGGKHEILIKECALAERSNQQIQNTIDINNKSHYQEHLNGHSGIKVFACDICMMQCTTKGNLKAHIKNKHSGNTSLKEFKCIECSFQSNYKNNLQKHMNKHRGITFTCDICMMKFNQKALLKIHIKNKHTTDATAKDYTCSECSYQTNYKANLQAHLNTHRGIKQFKCDICMKQFGQKQKLKSHIRNKHEDAKSVKDYICSECSYQTNYKANLQKHLNKHRGTKPFKCDICMKQFAQKQKLKSHIRNKHTDEESAKDYKCTECFYETNYKTCLQMHLDKHRGINFTCDICMMKFTQKGSLNSHIKYKHTDNGSAKDYKCPHCSFETRYKSCFHMHLNTHRGIKPFQCDICMIKFTQKGSLNVHMRNKHTINVNLFKCDICMVKFTTKGNLKAHIKNKHTNDKSAKY